MVDKQECAHKAEKLRTHFAKNNVEPIDPFALAARVPKLTVVLYPFSDLLSGLCVRTSNYQLIAVNSRHTLGRQNFTLAHEFHHLFFDEQMRSIVCPANTSRDPLEQTADCFASRFLVPDAALDSWCIAEVPKARVENAFGSFSFQQLDDEEVLTALLSFENRFGVSRSASLVRLVEAGVIDRQRADSFKGNVKRNARDRGFSASLYEPRRGAEAKRVMGDYVNLIGLLLGERKISEALATQLLADGFRDDISIVELEDDSCES